MDIFWAAAYRRAAWPPERPPRGSPRPDEPEASPSSRRPRVSEGRCDMTSQRQRPVRDLPEVPYFSLDMHTCPDGDVVEVLLTGDVDEATVGHLDDSLAWVVEHMQQRRVVVDLSGAQHVEPCGVLA